MTWSQRWDAAYSAAYPVFKAAYEKTDTYAQVKEIVERHDVLALLDQMIDADPANA